MPAFSTVTLATLRYWSRRLFFPASALVLGATMAGCGLMGGPEALDQPVVEQVDLARYAGLFYEISSIPSVASANGRCTNTTATYTLQPNGTVRLFNECFLDRPDGIPLRISGSARARDASGARLAIRFDFSFFEAPYNIIALDPEYRWAVVGSGPDGLFVLSRTPTLDDATYAGILALLPELGYDPDSLQLTPQTPR